MADNTEGTGGGAPAAASTTTAPAAGAPAAANPTPGSTPPSNAQPAVDPKATSTASTGAPSAFSVPDAWKEKPWAAKIKSEEDLYRQIDTLDALKGKKSIAPDFEKATAEEIETFLAQTRPADVNAYQFGDETHPEIKSFLGKSLMENGVHPFQANKVIKAYQEAEKGVQAQMFSKEGMDKAMEASFGADWQATVGKVQNIVKESIPADDKKALNSLPNEQLAMVTRVINKLIADYGIKERGNLHTDSPAGKHTAEDVTKVRTDLRKQIDDLTRRPHTEDEKKVLTDKLTATYA